MGDAAGVAFGPPQSTPRDTSWYCCSVRTTRNISHTHTHTSWLRPANATAVSGEDGSKYENSAITPTVGFARHQYPTLKLQRWATAPTATQHSSIIYYCIIMRSRYFVDLNQLFKSKQHSSVVGHKMWSKSGGS